MTINSGYVEKALMNVSWYFVFSYMSISEENIIFFFQSQDNEFKHRIRNGRTGNLEENCYFEGHFGAAGVVLYCHR